VMRTSLTGGREVTRARRASGTACYVAPEQATGRRQTVASDLYSVGAILFEILFGFPPHSPEHTATDFVIPFGKIDHFPVVVSRLTEEAVIPDQPAVPPRLREIVATLLRNEPTERFATAAMAKGEIDGVLESLLGAARDSSTA
jgi:serine/threonine protein kinase